MTPFSVYILGCGSAMPTMHHNPTSQVVSLRNKQFMVDCGEGTQLQLRKARIHFMKIEAVFISHLHGDHCLGLIGMMSTFGMLGRTAPLHIYAHEDLEPLLKMEQQLFCDKLEYDVVFHPIDTERETVVYDDKSVSISTLPLDHRIPCCGFLFREKPTLPHIRRDMIDYLEIPVSQINNIKLGADWTCPDGTVVPNSDLVVAAEKPRSYAYCSDTRYLPELAQRVRGVDLLYHESTYDTNEQRKAEKYYHSTAAQAALVARDAAVGRLLLGHYSSRYDDESVLLDEARNIFPEAYLTHENDIFNL